jgi:flagellar motility protein MotE (MotC chaperone)
MLDVGSLACGLVAALQYHIKNHDSSGSGSGSGSGSDDGSGSGSDGGSDSGSGGGSDSGSGGDSIYATIEYADYIKDIANSAAAKATTATETATSASKNVEAYSSLVNELKSTIKGWITNENEINGEKIHPNTIGKEALKHNILTGDHVQKNGSDLPDNQILVTNDLSDSVTDNISNKPASRAAVKKAYDKAVEALNNSGLSSGLSSDVFEVIDGALRIKLPIEFEDSANFISCSIGVEGSKASLTGAESIDAMTIYCANINPVHDGSNIVRIDGNLEVTGSITSSGNSSKYLDELYLKKNADIIIKNYYNYGDGNFGDGIISASALYEAVSWYTLSNPSTASINLSDEQQDTISELQATVQQQQETIATLEARLARLEQHLGLSDDI